MLLSGNTCISLRQKKFEDEEMKDDCILNGSVMQSVCLTNQLVIFSPYIQFNGNCINFRKKKSSKRLVLTVSTWSKLLQ